MRRFLLCIALAAPTSVFAQTSAKVAVTVRVVDSAGAAIAGADVAVVRGTSQTIAHGTTDASGRSTLALQRADEPQELRVRKIGFDRGFRFFSLGLADTLTLDLRLTRAVVSLAPVTVTAAEDLKRKSYHLDADDIENSSRPIIDGTDIFKLRPDMMTSRGGAQACMVPYTPRTGWIESVWVNGQRVTLADIDPMAVARKPALGIAVSPQRRPVRGMPPTATYSHIDTVLSILRTIHPEHIAEITYHDCFDASVGKNNSDLAMFIALKPGIGFKNGIGSYVIADSASHDSRVSVADLPRYRFRLLGVFDQESGDPLPDVDVIDSISGDRTKTTATGTVSLFFVPEGQSNLQLHRAGYRDTTLVIVISPSDTAPLTAVLGRRPAPRTTP